MLEHRLRWSLWIVGLCFCVLLVFFSSFEGAFVLPSHPIAYTPPRPPYRGMGVYIINLDRSVDRAQRIFPLALQLGYPVQRIPGVDGGHLSKEEMTSLVQPGCIQSKWSREEMRKGEVGCSLSHMRAWKTFLESSYAYALIFEDDTVFVPSELLLVIQGIMAYEKEWDMCSLQTNCGERAKALCVRKLFDGYSLFYPAHSIWLAGAYVINRKAAERYLEKAVPLCMPVDHYIYRNWEFFLKQLAVFPSPTHQFGASEIEKIERRIYGKKSSQLLRIRREVFRIKSRAMRLLSEGYVWLTFGCLWRKSGDECKRINRFCQDKM